MLYKIATYIPPEDRDFFLLLRAGLWQRVEGPLSFKAPSSSVEGWGEAIYRLACEQTVQGIVADGIGLYRAAYERGDFGPTHFPSGEGWGEAFLDQTAQIIRQNYKVNQVQAKVCQLLNEKLPSSPFKGDRRGSYVILKGQGIAQHYPKPMLRCSGDIDILLEVDYSRAKALLQPLATRIVNDDSYDIHTDLFFGDIEIELHGMGKSYFSKRADKAIERERLEMFLHSDFTSYVYNDTQIFTPSIKYHFVFLYTHIVRHITNHGLGVRQLCDWAIFIHKFHNQIDRQWLTQFIDESGNRDMWTKICRFNVDYLGMEPYDILGIVNYATVDASSVWKHCKEMGNMGHIDISKHNAPTGFVSRNVLRFTQEHARFKRNLSLDKRHAFRRLWRYYIGYIKAFFKKIFHVNGSKFND